MKNNRKNRISKGTMVALIVMVIGMIILNACWAEEPQWDVCYEMANRNVSWTYAGRCAE